MANHDLSLLYIINHLITTTLIYHFISFHYLANQWEFTTNDQPLPAMVPPGGHPLAAPLQTDARLDRLIEALVVAVHDVLPELLELGLAPLRAEPPLGRTYQENLPGDYQAWAPSDTLGVDPLLTCGSPMVDPWFTCGSPVVHLWFIYGWC